MATRKEANTELWEVIGAMLARAADKAVQNPERLEERFANGEMAEAPTLQGKNDREGRPKRLKQLFEEGANPRAPRADGKTPLLALCEAPMDEHCAQAALDIMGSRSGSGALESDTSGGNTPVRALARRNIDKYRERVLTAMIGRAVLSRKPWIGAEALVESIDRATMSQATAGAIARAYNRPGGQRNDKMSVSDIGFDSARGTGSAIRKFDDAVRVANAMCEGGVFAQIMRQHKGYSEHGDIWDESKNAEAAIAGLAHWMTPGQRKASAQSALELARIEDFSMKDPTHKRLTTECARNLDQAQTRAMVQGIAAKDHNEVIGSKRTNVASAIGTRVSRGVLNEDSTKAGCIAHALAMTKEGRAVLAGTAHKEAPWTRSDKEGRTTLEIGMRNLDKVTDETRTRGKIDWLKQCASLHSDEQRAQQRWGAIVSIARGHEDPEVARTAKEIRERAHIENSTQGFIHSEGFARALLDKRTCGDKQGWGFERTEGGWVAFHRNTQEHYFTDSGAKTAVTEDLKGAKHALGCDGWTFTQWRGKDKAFAQLRGPDGEEWTAWARDPKTSAAVPNIEAVRMTSELDAVTGIKHIATLEGGSEPAPPAMSTQGGQALIEAIDETWAQGDVKTFAMIIRTLNHNETIGEGGNLGPEIKHCSRLTKRSARATERITGNEHSRPDAVRALDYAEELERHWANTMVEHPKEQWRERAETIGHTVGSRIEQGWGTGMIMREAQEGALFDERDALPITHRLLDHGEIVSSVEERVRLWEVDALSGNQAGQNTSDLEFELVRARIANRADHPLGVPRTPPLRHRTEQGEGQLGLDTHETIWVERALARNDHREGSPEALIRDRALRVGGLEHIAEEERTVREARDKLQTHARDMRPGMSAWRNSVIDTLGRGPGQPKTKTHLLRRSLANAGPTSGRSHTYAKDGR